MCKPIHSQVVRDRSHQHIEHSEVWMANASSDEWDACRWSALLPRCSWKSREDGTDNCFNWTLPNGDRIKQRDEREPTNYTHILPAGSHNMIRSVNIHYTGNCVAGFSFYDNDAVEPVQVSTASYSKDSPSITVRNSSSASRSTPPLWSLPRSDKDRKLIWKIGNTTFSKKWSRNKTALLAENEVIVEVVCSLLDAHQSVYTDFQFKIGTRMDWSRKQNTIIS